MPTGTNHSVRIDDGLWSRVRRKCRQEGTSVSELIRVRFQEYLDEEHAPPVSVSQDEHDACVEALIALGVPGVIVDAINKRRAL